MYNFWGTFHQIIKQTTQHTVYRRTKCHNEMRNSQIPCTFDSLIHIEQNVKVKQMTECTANGKSQIDDGMYSKQ